MRCAAAVVAWSLAWTGAPRADVRYLVDVGSRAAEHLALVTITVEDAPAPLELAMPAWTPGAYERRDFGRHILELRAAQDAGKPLATRRLAPGVYRIEGHSAGASVTIRCVIRAAELSDDASEVNPRHAHLSGTSIYPRVRERAGRPHHVRLDGVPPGARVATVLDGEPDGGFRAPDYESLVDAPIEVGRFVDAETRVAGRPLRILLDDVAATRQRAVPKQLLTDVAALAEAEARVCGPPPWARYLFLIHLADGPQKFVALEHRASTSVIVPRGASAPGSDDYHELLYVAAHELFHAWNARVLRPAGHLPPDYEHPTPTRALWITEGLTEYYAHRAMRLAGFWTREQYLGRIGEEAARVRIDGPAATRSLEEQAEETFHAPDSDEPEAWYARGHLVALALDLALRQGGRSLDEAVRRLLGEAAKRGGALAVDTDTLAAAIAALGGEGATRTAAALDGWSRRPGDLYADPSFVAALSGAGLLLEVRTGAEASYLGLSVESAAGALRVAAVAPDGPAARAGVHAGDRLVTVDGAPLPATWPAGVAARKPGTILLLELARAGHALSIPVALAPRRPVEGQLSVLPDAPREAAAVREAWLGPARPP